MEGNRGLLMLTNGFGLGTKEAEEAEDEMMGGITHISRRRKEHSGVHHNRENKDVKNQNTTMGRQKKTRNVIGGVTIELQT